MKGKLLHECCQYRVKRTNEYITFGVCTKEKHQRVECLLKQGTE